MVWNLGLITLAAFGALSALWCLLGWLLPSVGDVMVCPEGADAHAVVRRYLWLRGIGLIRCPLIVMDSGLEDAERTWMEKHGVRVCLRSEMARQLGIGEKELDGTGNGDPPGRYQRCGVSEL